MQETDPSLRSCRDLESGPPMHKRLNEFCRGSVPHAFINKDTNGTSDQGRLSCIPCGKPLELLLDQTFLYIKTDGLPGALIVFKNLAA